MPDPLRDQIKVMQMTDAEIRRVAREAALEADKVIRSLEGKEGIGARVRSAQLSVAKTNAEMWAAVGDATKIGIGDAFDAAAESQALWDDALFRKAGFSASYWRMSQLATARSGIGAFLARRENGITLSQRVWRDTSLSRGYLDRAINNGLILGKSAREIANDVKGYLNPNVPGGASYAAMRLGRTEVNNAYHTQARNQFKNTPWIERVKWNLSGSHPRPDQCNEYAEGGDVPAHAGEWFPESVPDKPHPNCLCYVTPVTMDLDTYVKNFQDGQYDDYITEQIGCSVA